jgi:putative ABC transport system permease protein
VGVTLWVAQRHLRRRWVSLLPFLGVITFGSMGALLAINTASQTDSAYVRYLERAEVGDLLINPSIQTAEIDETIRSLPGVTEVVTDDLFYAAIGEYTSTGEAVEESSDVFVRGSIDGRHVSQDRLAYRSGRAPTGTNEAVVSVDAAELEGIEIGDRLPLSFASIQDDIRAIYLGEEGSVGILGVEYPTVVGIATFPEEVLPDGLYERGRVIVSADIAARYSCTPHEPPTEATIRDIIDQLAPAQCSTSYRYWSLRVEGGAPAAQATLDAFAARAAERNAELAPAMVEMGVQYVPIVTTTADEVAKVGRATQPTVVALLVIAVAAALLTIVIACLVLARALHRDDELHTRLSELGMARIDRAKVVGLPAVVAAIIGALVAIVGAFLLPTGPVGAVGVLEPEAAGLTGWARWMAAALIVGAVTSAFAVSIRVAVSTSWSARRVAQHARRRTFAWRGRPDVAVGVGEAVTWRRSSMLTWVTSTVAFAAFVAALVFGTSLNHLIASPTAYGWPWDLANMTGSGYGGVSVDTVTESLDGDSRVSGWTALGLTQGVNVDDVALPAVILFDSPTDSDVVLTAGRLPRSADEIALGSRSAAERSVGVGDQVSIAGDALRHDRATVTGIVVLPSIGPLQADRATPGRGVLLPDDAFETDVVSTLLTFVGIDAADGVDAAKLRSDLDDDFWAWELYDRPRPLAEPIRPPEITNAGSIRTLPALVGALVGAATAVGFGSAMLFAARARRHDLAVLRTLGFSDRQLRRSLRVQSVLTAVLTCGLGTVCGVIVGRFAWRRFAAELGVVPNPHMPLAVAVSVVLGAALLGLVAAIVPGSYATRLPPASALRTL